jgi:D-alanine-D-alanine ligase
MAMINVTIITGGRSSERDISLVTAGRVRENLNPGKYIVQVIDSADPAAMASLAQTKPDVAFVAQHGKGGEDGAIQGFLETLDIPYTGSGILASALALDKLRCKEVLAARGVKTPKVTAIRRESHTGTPPDARSLPIIVKPNSVGSSDGLTVVREAQELAPAIALALEFDDTVLVEEFISGMEITAAVIGNAALEALPLIEIVPAKGVYDREAKYTPGATDEICPARLSATVTARAQQIARDCHSNLGCRGMSRTDAGHDPNEPSAARGVAGGYQFSTASRSSDRAGAGGGVTHAMKRIPEAKRIPSADLPRRPSPDGNIDLTRALREREAKSAPPPRRPQPTGRRPVRPGSRVRMDVAKSTHSGPRVVPIPSAPRRRRNRKPINWRLVAPIALLTIAVAGSIVFALTTRRLAVRHVVFEGVPANIAATLPVDLKSNPMGHNVLAYVLLHGRAAQRQLEAAQPDFASAQVRALLPHTLIVQIVRRTPYAFLAIGPAGSGGRWILDDRGYPIDTTPAARVVNLPKIIVPAPTDGSIVTMGQPLPGVMADQAAQAYALLNGLNSQAGLGSLKSISVDKSENLGLNMSNNYRFRLGQSTQLGDKLALIAQLIAQNPQMVANAKYIDVSYPSRPALMPKSATTAAPDDSKGAKGKPAANT